jgi:O-methyltransferase
MLRSLTRRLLPKGGRDAFWHLAQRVAYPPDFGEADIALCERVRELTMTSPERVVALKGAVEYVSANGLSGAFVECGVWRGGSMVAIATVLQALGDLTRDLYLFDTFEGMTPASDRDVSRSGRPVSELLAAVPRSAGRNVWCIAGFDEVAANMRATGYPADRIHLVRGPVESTIPQYAPDSIALLRLDTDWYQSTAHELTHLYPRLVRSAALIIDDYGHWAGAHEAVDEYFATLATRPLLSRIDDTGRICVKP